MRPRREIRGGSWLSIPRFCHSAYRLSYGPDNCNYDDGFRVVCNKELPLLALQLRGGSWFSLPRYCRLAPRFRYEPGYSNGLIGFRVVCNEDEP